MRSLLLLLSLFTLTACSNSQPLKPQSQGIIVSRAVPDKNCKDLGSVSGRVKNRNGSFEEAIADMQLDAARLGGNYVQMGITGAHSQSVRGRAFYCD